MGIHKVSHDGVGYVGEEITAGESTGEGDVGVTRRNTYLGT